MTSKAADWDPTKPMAGDFWQIFRVAVRVAIEVPADYDWHPGVGWVHSMMPKVYEPRAEGRSGLGYSGVKLTIK